MNKIKNKLKLILVLYISLLTLLSVYFPIVAIADEPNESAQVELVDTSKSEAVSPPTILSKYAILMDQSTGQILYEHNSNEKAYPASTTKLMTAILTLERCELTDEVTINKKALLGIPRSYTTAALQGDEVLTVEQLLHVLLIPSANDAANVLAFHLAGSLEDFAAMMNAKATEIGCLHTHFVNPSGIHDDEHYSTAYDMALIGKYALQFDAIRQIAQETTCSLPTLSNGKERTFKATNTLITPKNQYYYEYATGLKTGYTDKSKSCIVATAEKDDKKLLCVVLHGEKTEDNKAQRELDCHTLFEYGFNNFELKNICETGKLIDKSSINSLPTGLRNADIAYVDSLSLLVLPENNPIVEYAFDNNIQLPIQKGTALGYVTYTLDNTAYKINLVAANDVYPVRKSSINFAFIILVIALVLLLLLSLRKKKRNRRESKYYKRSLY